MNKATIIALVKILCFSIPILYLLIYVYKLNLNNDTIKNIFLWFFLFLFLINIIISFIIGNSHQKIKKTKKYNRNLDNLLSPQDSCMIISKKFNFNNFVMTVLLNMHLQKKIVISNDKITLLKPNEFSDMEKFIFSILFSKNDLLSNQISLNQIKKNIKKRKNLKTYIKIIKLFKLKELFAKKIIDEEKYKKIMKLKLFISENLIFFIIELIALLIYIELDKNDLCILFVHFIAIFFPIKSPQDYLSNEKMSSIIFFILLSIILLIIIGNMKINLLHILLLINIISSLLILIFSNPIVFTEKGLQEYYKLKELENFIKDFSNLDDKEIKNIELWEEYLLYATAFGISEKITDNIPQKLINFKLSFESLNSSLNDLLY